MRRLPVGEAQIAFAFPRGELRAHFVKTDEPERQGAYHADGFPFAVQHNVICPWRHGRLFLLIADKRAAGAALFPRDDQGRQLVGQRRGIAERPAKSGRVFILPVGFQIAHLAHSAVGQRDFFRRLNHHRAELGHAIIGNAGNGPGNRDGGERLTMFIINA